MYNYKTYEGISRDRLCFILENISRVKVGFIGDLCIDIYWLADMRLSELSRETPHFPLPVIEERFAPGAGGNVLSNLAALCPSCIRAAGVLGDDWRGGLISECLKKMGIPSEYIIIDRGRTTNAYCKPVRKGISGVVYEDPRIDFTGAPLSDAAESLLIEHLNRIVSETDILCVSDQFVNGCVTEKIRAEISRLAGSRRIIAVADSRSRITDYRNVILKPNEVESVNAASILSGRARQSFYPDNIASFIEAADIIHSKLGCDIAMTLGSLGNIQFYGETAEHILSRKVLGELDICGAGDTFLSAYVCALAAGAERSEAGQIASLASEVTISKVGQTGTADRAEILARFDNAYQQKEDKLI